MKQGSMDKILSVDGNPKQLVLLGPILDAMDSRS